MRRHSHSYNILASLHTILYITGCFEFNLLPNVQYNNLFKPFEIESIESVLQFIRYATDLFLC